MKSTAILISILTFGFFFSALGNPEDFDQLFLKGNIAFGEEDFEKAIGFYNQANEIGVSANLLFNLGTAHAKSEDFPAAAFYFIETLKLSPNHEGATANLALIRDDLGSSFSPPRLQHPGIFMSLPNWLILISLSFWGVLISIPFSFIPSLRKPFAKLGFSIALLLTLSSSAAIYQHLQFKNWTLVAEEDAVLRLAPTDSSPGQLYLQRGHPVKIISSFKDFKLVKVSDSQQGYLLNSEIFSARVHKD